MGIGNKKSEINAIKKGEGRLSMSTPGGDAELLYKIEGNIMSIYHTFVPESERGKGMAEKLADEAFDMAREKHLLVRPDCPYILHYLEKHKDAKTMAVDPEI